MSTSPNPFGPARGYPLGYEAAADPGAVARFFNAVYAWMAVGLALTAVVAWWFSTRSDWFGTIFSTPVLIGLIVAELALVFTISRAVNRLSATVATGLFLLYAALNGVTLSVIFLMYARATIASAFAVTAGTFGAMSVYGMVTRRDLTRLGSLLFMALIGVIIASVVSFFWHSTMLTVIINYVGVLVFVGLTAYDTQRLKAVAIQTAGDASMAARYSVNGALSLYLDFLNLFLFILDILGGNRRR